MNTAYSNVFRWIGLALLPALAGCGIAIPPDPDFSATVERGAGEQPLLLDDILMITGSMMTPDEQRQALREMGIEDEDLIEALVNGL